MTTKTFLPIGSLQPFLLLKVIILLSICTGSVYAQKNNSMEKIGDMPFLADSSTLTKSDYLSHLDKVFEVVNKVPVTIASFTRLAPIGTHLTQDEAALALLKQRLSQTDRNINLQNLQMYQALLDEL